MQLRSTLCVRGVVTVVLAWLFVVVPGCVEPCAEYRDTFLLPVTITGESGQLVRATVRVESNGGDPIRDGGELRIAVRLGEAAGVVECSPSIEFVDGTRLGSRCVIERAEQRIVEEKFEQVSGKRRNVRVAAEELAILIRERPLPSIRSDGSPPGEGRLWELIIRVTDDGVAFRFGFPPPKPGEAEWPAIASESSRFEVPASAAATVLPLNSFTTSHEALYRTLPAGDLPAAWIMGTPLLLSMPANSSGRFALITEANLANYAGMYLSREPDAHTQEVRASANTTMFVTRLSPIPTPSIVTASTHPLAQPSVAVQTPLPRWSPWRVVMLADEPGRFLESDFILSLNEPCKIADTTWIHPGKSAFPWWNGYVDPVAKAQGIDVGLNTATMKYYIDFCAASGIECHSLDGKNDLAWYDGPIQYAGADPTKAVAGLDLPEVLAYAKSKGVKIRLWMHWRAAQQHMTRSFPLYRQWGIEGVMLDFMDRDDQEMVRWQRSAIELAAANHLTITLHGVAKPTGLERTYPNLLSSEGVWNLEQNKWDKAGCTSEHELATFFTRMAAGPMDFHQGGVREVPRSRYEPHWEAPLVIGSPCRTVASYVVLQNHMSMVADYPSAYTGRPEIGLIAKIPATWDDTKVITGEVGQVIAIARRTGKTWWIGAMTNAPRTLTLPLLFLGGGAFEATLYEDDPAAPGGMAVRTQTVRSMDSLQAKMGEGGGWVARISQTQTASAKLNRAGSE